MIYLAKTFWNSVSIILKTNTWPLIAWFFRKKLVSYLQHIRQLLQQIYFPSCYFRCLIPNWIKCILPIKIHNKKAQNNRGKEFLNVCKVIKVKQPEHMYMYMADFTKTLLKVLGSKLWWKLFWDKLSQVFAI